MTDQKTSDHSSQYLPAGSQAATMAAFAKVAEARAPHQIGEWSREAWSKAKKQLKTDCIANDARHWFALITGQWCERRVATYLIGYGVKCYLPMTGGYERRGAQRRKVWAVQPMFPEYVFVRLGFGAGDRKAVQRIHAIPGVIDFLKFGEYYPFLDDEVMHRISHMSAATLVERDQPSIWSVGERVLIKDGPFADFTGEISELDRNGQIELLLSLFGRATRSKFDVGQIEKL